MNKELIIKELNDLSFRLSQSSIEMSRQDASKEVLRISKEVEAVNNFPSKFDVAFLDISKVTVRKYMHYLTKNNEVIEQINYDTGGRPCMVYFMK